MPRLVENDTDIARCFAVMSELRPHTARATFVATVRDMMGGGYRLACSEHDGVVVAVAGYRVSTNFHLGRHLFVEDLVVASDARSGGHGGEMLDWLTGQARAAGCRHIDLVSGTQRERAHKFYITRGFAITSFHFSAAVTHDAGA